jgi:hypothetical protein
MGPRHLTPIRSGPGAVIENQTIAQSIDGVYARRRCRLDPFGRDRPSARDGRAMDRCLQSCDE